MPNILISRHTKTYYYDHNGSSLKETFSDVSEQQSKIHCIGTPMYKGVPADNVFKEVISRVYLQDLDLDALKGNFLILFINNNSIKVLCDRTHQHHLFYDKKNKSLSISFLELVKNTKYELELNSYGFYEKVALGFHLGEDTLFDSIIRVSPENVQEVDEFDIQYLSEHKLPKLDDIKLHSGGRKKSLKCQEDHLNQYFSLINDTFDNKSGDLGISGGFDCRLLLALAQKNIHRSLHLHTHATTGVHENQRKYADKIAQVYGTKLTRVSTTSPSKLDSESFTQMLDDNIDFFDGRSARHLGAYSQTYTEHYKAKSMQSAYYSLNGLGGEIYRDSYFTGSKKLDWDEWAERYLFLTAAKAIVPHVELKKISAKAKIILEKRLQWNKNYYDIMFTHAYYGLIKMPLCNGSVVSAYNKVSPFLLPFIEYDNVIEALKAIPYLGIGGQYQANLMTNISPELARITTHYGGTFKSLSLKYYAWSLVKAKSSAKQRDTIVVKKMVKKANSPAASKELSQVQKLDAFKQSIETLNHIDDRLRLKVALIESTNKRNVTLLGHFLRIYL